MSGLPIVACPSCGARASLDVLLGHAGARDALLAIAQLHPAMKTLTSTALRYVGLFAPGKRELSFDRVAAILGELAGLIGSGRVERHGRSWPAPVDAWVDGMAQMLASRDRLALPLKSHGYLVAIVVGAAERAEGSAEQAVEQKRAYAYSSDRQPDGGGARRAADHLSPAPAAPSKTPMPAAVGEQLAALGMRRKPKETQQ